jgi:hypothetical protein
MIIKFSEFIIEKKHEIELHYFVFDWDDNILHMPTVIHMDKLVNNKWIPNDVSTSKFAIVRNDKENYRLINDNPDEAFSEFRDTGPRGENAFFEDVMTALKNNQYGPSWDAFKKCLSEGSLFAIITARGHEPITIRHVVEYIIDNELTEEEQFLLYSNCLKHSYLFRHDKDYDRIPKGDLSKTELISVYLDNCDFWGVSSDAFAKKFGEASASNPEKAKELALENFIEKCNDLGKKIDAKKVSVGFSDDDPKNVEHVRKYFKEKSALFNEMNPHDVSLTLFKTTDRNIKGGEPTKFKANEANVSTQAPGMASSVASFKQFNNITKRYYNDGDTQPSTHTHNLYVDELKSISDEVIKQRKKLINNGKDKKVK